MEQFRIGWYVVVARGNDNENYDSFRDKTLKVVEVYHNIKEHPLYDESIGQPLYKLETKDGEEVPFLLYHYELEKSHQREIK
jgi:hypothetical protein